jgi:hypothetical protein
MNWTDGATTLFDDGSVQIEGHTKMPKPKKSLFKKGKSHKQCLAESRRHLLPENKGMLTIPEYEDYLMDCYFYCMKPRYTKEEWHHYVYELNDKEFEVAI